MEDSNAPFGSWLDAGTHKPLAHMAEAPAGGRPPPNLVGGHVSQLGGDVAV